MPSEPLLFIHDQRIFTLELAPHEHASAHDYLQIERLPDLGRQDQQSPFETDADRYRSRWKQAPSRSELLGDVSRRRVCITVGAGCGKSIAIEQLTIVRESLDSGHLGILVHFSSLPDHIDGYPEFMVEQFSFPLNNLSEHERSLLPGLESHEIYTYVHSLLRTGRCTLAVDGLDEINTDLGKKKAAALRTFLSRYPAICCCVAGRPYAIQVHYWKELFSTRGKDGDISSSWDFWLVGSFTQEQIQEYLGKTRYEELQQMQTDVEFTPRVLETFRTLRSDVLTQIRSVADVYWHSIDKSLRIDRNKIGQSPNTDLNHNEILDFLSACAITLVMWRHDPTSKGDLTANRVQQGQEPVNRIENTGLDRFQNLVFERMQQVYGRLWPVEEKWRCFQQLCLSYIEFQFFMQDPNGLVWRNATERDFFAALWMLRSSSSEERKWLANRQSKVVLYDEDASRIPELHELWRFVCGMPDVAMIEREDGLEKLGRWMDLLRPVYEPGCVSYRATEIMFLSWPNLLLRAGFLKGSWNEDDLLAATLEAQEKFGGKDPAPSVEISDPEREKSLSIVESFLRQYPTLRDGGGIPAGTIAEDLENSWCDCRSQAGMMVRVGDRDMNDNPEHIERLSHAFSINAYQVTSRLYALFDGDHAARFCHYSEYNPDEQGPVIYLTWYDAMMMCIWCHGYLPSEWEWEYASRAEQRNSDGTNAIYYWGNDRSLLIEHGWVSDNSGDRIHRIGQRPSARDPKNGFGLYDTLGNVGEWTRSRYERGNPRRVVRGGAFSNSAYIARCSFRNVYHPLDTDNSHGVRILRAR
jgi:hypothetical protein